MIRMMQYVILQHLPFFLISLLVFFRCLSLTEGRLDGGSFLLKTVDKIKLYWKMASLLRAGLRQTPRLVAFSAAQRVMPAAATIAVSRLMPVQVSDV